MRKDEIWSYRRVVRTFLPSFYEVRVKKGERWHTYVKRVTGRSALEEFIRKRKQAFDSNAFLDGPVLGDTMAKVMAL